MQDCAKSIPVTKREIAQAAGEWKPDAVSVLFGVLLGAMVIFAGIKAAEYRETQPTIDREVNETFVEDTSLQFQFYTELKREDLYPVLSK